ncbi:hypothetical protein JT05_05345 [Desulfosporosinus sp. Tol-M]|nr:hypothetical protein JT05_05345 [Desulfosporosinus sp. Tol-M]
MWSEWLTPIIGVRTLASVIMLITGTVIGVVVFAGMVKLLRREEFIQAMGLVNRKIGNRWIKILSKLAYEANIESLE